MTHKGLSINYCYIIIIVGAHSSTCMRVPMLGSESEDNFLVFSFHGGFRGLNSGQQACVTGPFTCQTISLATVIFLSCGRLEGGDNRLGHCLHCSPACILVVLAARLPSGTHSHFRGLLADVICWLSLLFNLQAAMARF